MNSVVLPCAHQLDDPADTTPLLAVLLGGIAGPDQPAHLAAMARLEIADINWEVPVPSEQGGYLLIEPSLVVLDRQEQVGTLLDGELKSAIEVCSASACIDTSSSSRLPRRVLRAT